MDFARHRGVAEQVDVLAGVPEAVGPSEPEAVVDPAVDALGVVATGVEPGEDGVVGWDGPKVLGPVELARPVRRVPWSRTVIVVPPRRTRTATRLMSRPTCSDEQAQDVVTISWGAVPGLSRLVIRSIICATL
jgi:hypothetical protein